MRILHVIASLDPRHGGPVSGLQGLAGAWRDMGHEVEIACLDPVDAPWLASQRLPVVAHGGPGLRLTGRHLRPPFARYGYTTRLAKWLRTHRSRFDVVVVHGLWNYTSIGSWRGLHPGQTPDFLFTHGMLDPWFRRAQPLKGFLKALYWRLLERRVVRDARLVFFTAEEERRLAGISFQPYVAREQVVGYGTSVPDFDVPNQTAAFYQVAPDLRERKFILCLGRIHPKKGLDILIRAFARDAQPRSDIDLVIAGPDSTGIVDKLASLSDALGVAARVHFLPMLTGDAKWGAYHAADFFALASHQENFGVVIAEALAAGKPVLTTTKVAIWREIEAAGAGVIVEDSADSVEQGLLALYSQKPGERRTMEAAARRLYEERYDFCRVAADLIDVFAAASEQALGAGRYDRRSSIA